MSETATTVTETPTTEVTKPAIVDTKGNDSNTETKVTFDPKTYKEKVKIDGKEIEVTLDELKRDYQIKKVSDQKMMTATAIERKAQAILERFEKDPESIIKEKLGPNAYALAEKILAEKIERELETAEQKELRELREWRAEKERTEAEKQAADLELQAQEMKAKYADDYKTQIIEVLDTSGLPVSTSTVRRVAYYMQQALERGQEKSAKEVIGLVKADFLQEMKELTAGMDAKTIIDNFGADFADKVRKFSLEKVKTPLDVLKTPEKQASKDSAPKKKHKMTMSEFRKL